MKRAGSLASSVKKRYITIPMLILLLAPTILSLLMGAEFIHLPFQKVPTVIVNHDHSETVQSLIQLISDNRTFDVIACTDEEDDLKEAFYYNKALAGIVIPEHFSEDLLNGREAKIMIFNDGALSTVASGMRGTIAEALGKPLNALHVASDFLARHSGPYDFRGELLGDKSSSVVFDNTKIKRAVPDFVCTVSMAEGLRQSVVYMLDHPETQVEDPEFDRWCDRIVMAQRAADQAFEKGV